MIRVQFADTASRDAFADRFKLDTKVGDTQLDITWNFLQFAKLDDKALDYDEVALLTAGPSAVEEREFIVKGDPATFGPHATVKEDLGNGFYLVSSSNGLLLGDFVDSIDHTSSPATFLSNASDINQMNGTASNIDPTSPEGQWARIRCASRYRPLLSQYSTHEMVYSSKPELYIIDTGINFDHPEFDYPELEKENFYTLPRYNNNFTDERGHGTAVASMAVGKNLGIANHCKLLNVKIADAATSASLYEIGQALDAIAGRVSSDPTVTRIVNMSFICARSSYLDSKVQNLIDLGVTVVCAAGNTGISVEDCSPAGIDDVITVASCDKYDIPSGFNNISPGDGEITTGHGLSLDIFAPGEDVMVASNSSGYIISSGTSFSAPLVAGIACEIAAIKHGMVPFSVIKQNILDTATTDALLFETDSSGNEVFSDNQNKIAYIFTSDPNGNYKADEMSMYVGVHYNHEPITFDLNKLVDGKIISNLTNENIVYSIEWSDSELESVYKSFISVDPVTGLVTILEPTVALPQDVKLKMVDFIGVAKISGIKISSPIIFFFHANSDYSDTQQVDITAALTDVNSVSYFAAWTIALK